MNARRGILFSCFLFFGLFIFSAGFSCAAGPTPVSGIISKETTWKKDNSPYIIQSNVYVQAKLTLEPGTVVKFSQPAYSMYIGAEFSARGTKNEKIVFTSIHDDDSDGVDSDKNSNPRSPQTSDWKSIYVNPNYKVEFNNAIISYGKVALSATSSGSEHENLTIRNSQISHALTGIYMENLEPIIDGNLITKNSTGIIAFINNGFDRLTTVSNNSFVGNGLYGVYGYNSVDRSKPAVDARNNWWGSANGPSPVGSGKGNEANYPFVLYDPWLGKDPSAGPDPVIVIPGIMGSWKKDGKWQIDPIFHTYDNLCEEFLANGYEDGKNFSVFPYEWRDSNVKNAKLLRDRINQIKADTGRPKVDIVAHSMGGLLAREYIESDYYQKDVDQLITIGTPQLGAPKDYIKWEAGAFFSDIFETAGKYFFEHEAKENGYDSTFHYIRGRPMASVQELLPAYDYLYDDNGKDYTLRSGYPVNYPRNEFLENLNNADKAKMLKNVEFTKIVGKQDKITTTISGFSVINRDMGELWKYGYPHGFEVPWIGDQGLRKSDGDGTVPLYSAESSQIPADHVIYFKSGHNNLPADSQLDILEILTGKRPDEKIDEWKIDDILIGMVFSPVDIQIVSPSGKRLGKNFETGGTFDEIEGAYYTGFDTNTEFLTIPNPEDGEYKILTEGTGTGDYTIETTKISQDKSTSEVVESTATIVGTAEPQIQEENKIEINGDSVKNVKPLAFSTEKENEEKSSVEISQTVPESSQNQTKIQRLDSLKNSVRDFFKTGQIAKKGERDFLLSWLGNIRVYLKRRQLMEEKSKIGQKAYNNLQKKIVGHCDYLIRHINKNSPKKIDPTAADVLIEELNSLKL